MAPKTHQGFASCSDGCPEPFAVLDIAGISGSQRAEQSNRRDRPLQCQFAMTSISQQFLVHAVRRSEKVRDLDILGMVGAKLLQNGDRRFKRLIGLGELPHEHEIMPSIPEIFGKQILIILCFGMTSSEVACDLHGPLVPLVGT